MGERKKDIIAIVPLGSISRSDLEFAKRQGIVRNVDCDLKDTPVHLNFDDIDSKGKPRPGWGKD